MKRLWAITVVIAISFSARGQLRGTVTDKSTGQPVPGATLLLPELKQATITDATGGYVFPDLKKGKIMLQVRMLGYGGLNTTVDLNTRTVADFQLETSILEHSEVVITGSAFTVDVRRTPLAVVPLEGLQITRTGSDNLIQSLTAVPGISTISTGNGIAKPVIRGLSYNRVVIVNQGVRQEGQQWGSEHGPEIDQFAAEHVEILKGPASLEYGSDAIGGVIHLLEPVPPPQGAVRGRLNSQFSTNNLLTGNSLLLEGNHSGFVWRTRGSYKSAGPFRTPKETVYNSGFSENALDMMAGVNRRWGYSHLNFSRWSSLLGLTEGDRDSLTGAFVDGDGRVLTEKELNGRKPVTPFQRVEHLRIASTNNVILGNKQLRMNAGLQQNGRREFEDSPDSPGINMRLRTATFDSRLLMTSGSSFEAAAGCSGMLQSNENLGLEYLIPDYRSMDAGIFLTAKSSPGRSTFSGGLRFDTRSMRSESLMIEQDTVFNRLEKEFMAFTGSAGWSFSFNDRNSVKANFGKGFRAPTVSELSANGLHEGTFRYEVGNPALQPEVSYEFDAGVIHDRELFSVHADLFVGYIRDFIYYARSLNETRAVDGGIYPVYRYLQDNVVRQGGELTLDLHPWPALHFENSAAFVYAENRNTGRPLAFTPPARTTHELRYDFKSRSKKGNIYFNFSLDNVFAQNRIDEFETSTAGYLLLNAGAGFEGRIGKTGLRLFANLRNITNETYFDHLSRYKDISVNGPGRNLTTGVEIDF